jgi:hypothetical protein
MVDGAVWVHTPQAYDFDLGTPTGIMALKVSLTIECDTKKYDKAGKLFLLNSNARLPNDDIASRPTASFTAMADALKNHPDSRAVPINELAGPLHMYGAPNQLTGSAFSAPKADSTGEEFLQFNCYDPSAAIVYAASSHSKLYVLIPAVSTQQTFTVTFRLQAAIRFAPNTVGHTLSRPLPTASLPVLNRLRDHAEIDGMPRTLPH